MPKKIRTKHLRLANAQSAVFVREAVKRNAPVLSGRLRRNIKSKRRRGKQTYVKSSVFIQTHGTKYDPKNAFYWRFVERGHTDRGGRMIPGTFFILRAAISQFRRVVTYQTIQVRRGIAAEIRKLRKAV